MYIYIHVHIIFVKNIGYNIIEMEVIILMNKNINILFITVILYFIVKIIKIITNNNRNIKFFRKDLLCFQYCYIYSCHL